MKVLKTPQIKHHEAFLLAAVIHLIIQNPMSYSFLPCLFVGIQARIKIEK